MSECVDCGTRLPDQYRGRPKLRCDSCRAAYKYASKMGRITVRPCRGGCGRNLAGTARTSYCPTCRTKREHA